MATLVGSRLGPYEVLAPLGAGGMGEVYRARDSRLARDVAIKVLPAELSSDPARLKRFEKEARSASALNHPNIVTIYDIGSENGVSYIAMERVEGETLRELLAGGPMSLRRLLQVATQVADGLATAHESGIVHRDLKPENVMVTKAGLVKILDFGLAKLSSTISGSGDGSQLPTMTGTTPGAIVGTVGYMSPEQASGDAVDFRSDHFSFGSILYEMATGRRAFQRRTAVDTLSAILNEEPEAVATVNPQAPAPVRWIVERCLAKDPSERYAATRDLARELATLRAHLTEAASLAVAPAEAKHRRPIRGALAIGAALAAIGIGVLLGRPAWRTAPARLPTFQPLTFGEHAIQSARFAPDGETVVYGIIRGNHPFELFSTRIGSLESRSLGLNADILSISAGGMMAIMFGQQTRPGTLAEVPLTGGTPREILRDTTWAEWSPDGKGLAVVTRAEEKMRLEFPIGKTLFESSDFIGRPRFSRDGTRILFADAGAIRLANLRTQKVALVLDSVGSGYDWSPRGDEVWFTRTFGGTTELRAFAPGGSPPRVIATLPGEYALHDVARNGRILLEQFAPRVEMFGLAPGQTQERNLTWLDGSVPADLSADGRTLLFSETAAATNRVETAYLRGTDGSPAIRLGEGYALSLSPDAKWAMAQRGTVMVLLPTGGGEPRPVTAQGIAFEAAAFLPDGNRVLLSGHEGGVDRLYLRNVDGGDVRQVGGDGVILPPTAQTISPDGRLVAAVDAADASWKIYAVEGADGPRPIAGLLGGELPIRWTADGRSLFVLGRNGSLHRLDPRSGQRQLLRQFRPGSSVRVSADGSAYVYGYGRMFTNLMLMEGLSP